MLYGSERYSHWYEHGTYKNLEGEIKYCIIKCEFSPDGTKETAVMNAETEREALDISCGLMRARPYDKNIIAEYQRVAGVPEPVGPRWPPFEWENEAAC